MVRGLRAVGSFAMAAVALAICLEATAAAERAHDDCVPNSARRPGPPLRLEPASGPVGTRVRLSGGCFGRHWNAGYGIFLLKQFRHPRECEVIAGGPYRFVIDRHHQAHGWFVVAADGACFQHPYRRRVTPGVYHLGVGCHACHWATFRVTRARVAQ